MEVFEHAVVGGGIAGLLFARQLVEAGQQCVVLDKGRGFGGRLATRRGDGVRFDHGAQYFTVRDPQFQLWVDQMCAEGVVHPWFEKQGKGGQTEQEICYIGKNGMSDIAKWLAEPVDVRRSTRVSRLQWIDSCWHLETADGPLGKAKELTLAVPVPQALDLLTGSCYPLESAEIELLAGIRYAKSIAVLAVLDGPSGLPEPGGISVEHPHLSWIADNRRKGISGGDAITLHSTARFGEEHWESDNAVRAPQLIDAAANWVLARVVSWSCHRWGYAFPEVVGPEPFFAAKAGRLRCIGDAFGGPRVEGAATSALLAFSAL